MFKWRTSLKDFGYEDTLDKAIQQCYWNVSWSTNLLRVFEVKEQKKNKSEKLKVVWLKQPFVD